MEYVYGTKNEKEILRTKGCYHTDLTGYHEVERQYLDQIITDNFRVVQKYDSKEDCEGNCYDWYEIDHHIRTQDKFTPVKGKIETGIVDTQDALCETSADFDQRIADIEDALCELTEGE